METPIAQKANPGIAPATGVGAVHVAVTDRDRALRFYKDTVGLRALESQGDTVRLGVDDRELVVLHPGASGPVARHRTGLYHLALVLPSRRDLAVVIRRLLTLRYPNSPTDHLITKADY